jgi:Na+/proline symporter
MNLAPSGYCGQGQMFPLPPLKYVLMLWLYFISDVFSSEYLVGGRSMPFLPVAISLVVSFESSIMMLGYPAESYVYGIQFTLNTFGYFVSNLLSIFIGVPLLHPLKITSAYKIQNKKIF